MPRAPSPAFHPVLPTATLLAGAIATGAAHAGGRPQSGPAPGAPTGSASSTGSHEASAPVSHPYVGMWVTDDGYIRHELRADGRYDEARGHRRSAYQGRYTLSGNHIDYVDDTGFTADGEFINGVLHHGGMVLRRAPATPAAEAD
jgi:Agrobacterium tumefaciens protein Atu4866.